MHVAVPARAGARLAEDLERRRPSAPALADVRAPRLLADGRQAQAMVKALRRFEQKGGLSTTDNLPLGQYVPGAIPTQWAYPNGWAPLHFVVVKGLQRYGYHDDARRIAMKWLRTNLEWFNENGIFLEKYNVANPDKPPLKGVYPSQTGFGWTNGVFERFCQEFIDGSTPGGLMH